ncbi:MAG: ATP-binding protein [Gammaproteobacteria bacterium RIFOXYA12_FULL_61_12]|nr:MAG: ATP-binding protein [Gammaproteobacteria bacterium RIFOXYD12_FULL_61_37]OGT94504.1 MAG: ATP-binding protein [Gammaproteobacteria bacterium RIFOXYA12_FULL_61_12]
MPKHLIRKFFPDHEQVRHHKHLRIFGKLIHDPNLWHMNRRSVSGAFFVGLFCAVLPIFPQMVTAAAFAIVTRVNLPISVALVWVSNPITTPPLLYVMYQVGTWMLGEETSVENFQMSAEWVQNVLGEIWWLLFLGGIVVGLVLGILGYALVRGYWRWHVVREMRKRKARREQAGALGQKPDTTG